MLRLLSLKAGNRQLRQAKKMASRNAHDQEITIPKLSDAKKSRSATYYIAKFRDSLQNFRPVDNKNKRDLNVNLVILPFETPVQFHRY